MFTNIIIIDVIRNIFLSWHVVWMITLYILLLLTIDDAWRDLWQDTRAEKWCRPIIYEILWNTFWNNKMNIHFIFTKSSNTSWFEISCISIKIEFFKFDINFSIYIFWSIVWISTMKFVIQEIMNITYHK